MLPLLVILASKLFSGESPPQISMTSWLPSEQYEWVTDDSDGAPPISQWENSSSVWIVPASVQGLSIVCNASYPVQWDFVHGHMDDDRRKRITLHRILTSRREASNIFDQSTYNYIAELRLMGDDNFLTGNYTCVSGTDATFKSTVYLFWEGNSPPYLTKAGENITVYFEQESVVAGEEDVLIPCQVAMPSVVPDLYKRVNGSWTLFNVPGVAYNPVSGFSLGLSTEAAFGQYMCTTYSPDDDMYVNVVKANNTDIEPYPFEEYLHDNATFTYNETSRKFTCCSSSYEQPILQIVYCDHPTMCQIKKRQMDWITNNGKRHSDSSCTSAAITYQTSGVIKCVGDGVSVFREYFFPTAIGIAGILAAQRHRKYPIIVTGKPYYRWDEADPLEMISISTNKDTIYAGDYFRVTCRASQYYFAMGIRWGILWANDTKHIEPDIDPVMPLIRRFYVYPGISRHTILAEPNMTAISCFAPVWNTTQYIEKSLILDIQEPVAPWITDQDNDTSANVEYIWDLGDGHKSLECTGHGLPTPTITWTRDGHEISESFRRNSASVLEIGGVTISSGGTYACFAKNLAGNVTKSFHVTVDVPMSALVVSAVVVAVGLFCVTIGFIGFLVRKTLLQKESIEGLKTVAFRDVLEQQQQQQRSGSYVTASPIVTDIDDDETGDRNGFSGLVISGSNYHKF